MVVVCDICGKAIVLKDGIRDELHFCDVCLEFKVADCERIRNGV